MKDFFERVEATLNDESQAHKAILDFKQKSEVLLLNGVNLPDSAKKADQEMIYQLTTLLLTDAKNKYSKYPGCKLLAPKAASFQY